MKSKKSKGSALVAAGLALGLALTFPAQTFAAGTYTAVSGDSLFKIGQVFSTTAETLIADNGLRTIEVAIGQKLTVPCATYQVQKGDTLYAIAMRKGISLAALRRANNLYIDTILVGQVLNIPAPATTTVSVPAANPTTAPAPTTTAPAQTAPTPGSYTAEDLDLLARLIMAEAQGESYETKVAVGAVVVNRVESGLFAPTIREVIYQKYNGYYQFTPVANGWINKPASEECVKAAKEALGGADPSKGALFFYDNTTTSAYMLNKPVTARIGSMIFAA